MENPRKLELLYSLNDVGNALNEEEIISETNELVQAGADYYEALELTIAYYMAAEIQAEERSKNS